MARDGESYFTGDRGYWDDPDFDTIEQQAVYAMLWQSHGTDIAGIRQRNDRLDAVRVNLTLSQFQDTLSILYRKGKLTLYPDRIWIKPAIWRNLNKGKYSEKQMAAVVTRLKSCGPSYIVKDIIEYYKKKYDFKIPSPYPIDTLCNGYPSVTVSVTVSEPVTVTELTTVGTLSENGQSADKKQLKPEEEIRRKTLERMLPYLSPEHIPYMPKSEPEKYKLAGWLVKKCLNRPEVALEFLHQKCSYLAELKDLTAFRKMVTTICQNPETMGEIESAAHREQSVETRGGEPTRIGEVLKNDL